MLGRGENISSSASQPRFSIRSPSHTSCVILVTLLTTISLLVYKVEIIIDLPHGMFGGLNEIELQAWLSGRLLITGPCEEPTRAEVPWALCKHLIGTTAHSFGEGGDRNSSRSRISVL